MSLFGPTKPGYKKGQALIWNMGGVIRVPVKVIAVNADGSLNVQVTAETASCYRMGDKLCIMPFEVDKGSLR